MCFQRKIIILPYLAKNLRADMVIFLFIMALQNHLHSCTRNHNFRDFTEGEEFLKREYDGISIFLANVFPDDIISLWLAKMCSFLPVIKELRVVRGYF